MIPVAVIGLALCMTIWNARPQRKGVAAEETKAALAK
jgi:hypothetical protein